MAKCGYCNKRKGKRYCPSLDCIICPQCCGENRLRNIDCPSDCKYLTHESYQQNLQKAKEFKELINIVPHGKDDDIFHDERAAMIAYSLEYFFADVYLKGYFDLIDNHVFEALQDVYYARYQNKEIKFKNEFTKLLDEVIDLSQKGWDNFSDRDFQGKILLRLAISTRKMTGGTMGPCSYLNYLKNNIHSRGEVKEGYVVTEDKYGEKKLVSLKE